MPDQENPVRKPLIATALAVAITSSLVPASALAQTTSGTNVYVATPATGCNDANDGATPATPVCTFKRADAILNAEFNSGAKRGDAYVRIKSGKAATRTPASRTETSNLEFAPGPNTTLHIVPDWYQTGMSPNPVVSGQEDALSSLGSSSGSFFTMILDMLRKIFDAIAALFTGAGSTK